MNEVEHLYQPDPNRRALEQGTTNLSNEYVNDVSTAGYNSLRRTISDVSRAALALFDGDKPLEITNVPAKDKPKQDWLVVMNLATDFGNECTIEKRTKKLQELAADTAGKPVTILVQTAVKDGDTGKYKLERFALSDGKVLKLESPGRSAGYAGDVEQLLKFANKEYKTTNLALILDSHGSGNAGLHGDTGDVSMAQLKECVKKGLEGSGHDKLDLLQFDACLMAQNGVLESTRGLAKHIVASAEPEGTGAQGRDFDNKVLSELLKKPSMTADDLAEIAVKQAKDNAKDFPTLAHFDMAHYDRFRESLDSFGEKLAKSCEDPAQLEVIRGIITDTFAYGSGRLNWGNIFQHFGPTMPKPEQGGFWNSFFSKDTLPTTVDSSSNGLFCQSSKRDLKDFVAKVLLAISKGQLKDEDGSLRKAAQAVLIDGTRLIKSSVAEGEKRKNVGGLSAFLPASAAEAGSSELISSERGWRQFQRTISKNGVEKKK